MPSPTYVARRQLLEVFAADGQAVLYDGSDDATHFLADVAWAVYSTLADRPRDADALKTALQAEFPDDPAEAQAAAVDEALQALVGAGLVRASP